MSIVRILFLSDLHFKKTDEDYAKKLKECSSVYIESIGNLDSTWRPQIVAIAGDIGFTGAKGDYEFFDEVFFTPLMNRLGIDSSHIILCPGNHDKDDTRVPYRSDESETASWTDIKKIEKIDQDVKETFYEGYRVTRQGKNTHYDKSATNYNQKRGMRITNKASFLRRDSIVSYICDTIFSLPKYISSCYHN